VGKPHLDLLALSTGLLEGFGIGQCPDLITDVLIEIASDLARNGRCALGFSEQTEQSFLLAR
jgi:hypothetical protein